MSTHTGLSGDIVLGPDELGHVPRAIEGSRKLGLNDRVTVEAWVNGTEGRAEILQALVSKWHPLDTFTTFSGYDAGAIDGLKTKAYFGAVFDGRYVYFAPQHDPVESHGRVLRYDTHGDFRDAASYAAHDAGRTAGLASVGYYGAVFDGRYVYFVPRRDHAAGQYHSRILRLDTRADFHSPDAWDAHDVGETHSSQGAAFDGRYIYFCPGYADGPGEGDLNARVIRYDTQAALKSRGSYSVFDAAAVDGLAPACYDGGAFDGRYIYFVPLLNGVVLRYDTRGDFAQRGSWSAFDAKAVGMQMCVGAVFDGRHLYFVPYANGTVVRVDTDREFHDPASWESMDASRTGGLATNGYDGGFFDGRYVYFIPFVGTVDGKPVPDGKGLRVHGNYLRYDPTRPFAEAASWASHDAAADGPLKTLGYNGGAFDGRYAYTAPWRDGTGLARGELVVHGRIQRYDTLGTNGSFSLRYCDYGHNGGLCAAVPGPSFLVNTVKGPLSVAAHRALAPGRHHLRGTYDGKRIRLVVDGMTVAEREGSGLIQDNNVPVVVGGISNGLGAFRGSIEKIRISPSVQD